MRERDKTINTTQNINKTIEPMPKKMVKVMIAKGRVLLNPPTTNPPITDQPTIDHLLTNPPTNQPPTYRPKVMIAKGKVKRTK